MVRWLREGPTAAPRPVWPHPSSPRLEPLGVQPLLMLLLEITLNLLLLMNSHLGVKTPLPESVPEPRLNGASFLGASIQSHPVVPSQQVQTAAFPFASSGNLTPFLECFTCTSWGVGVESICVTQ